ncbi:caspase domain-containing protein [Streptomyces monticola]|uniref:Caspase domain-containing protein n=1 Tax=Streptomyces monticola TaxID=2666263 RepID=A0ABW2JF41_9ACTN
MVAIPDPGKSRAVLIGIGDYTHPALSAMPAAPAGAQHLAGLLRDPSIWGLPEEHITVIGSTTSVEQVLGAVRDAALGAQDTLLVYFAGHGLRDRDEQLYLALAAADVDYPQVGALPYGQLRDVVRRSGYRARHRVTVLDCCYSGIAGGMSGTAAPTRTELARALGESEDAGGASDDQEGAEDHRYGDCVLTSAPPTSLSFVPQGARFPEFTGELIDVLETGIPGADVTVSLETTWRRVRDRLRRRGSPEPQQFAQNAVTRHLHLRNRAVPFGPEPEAKAEPDPSTQQAAEAPDPYSWNSSGTDQTPFAADALLPRRFTNDRGIEFARVAGGLHSCVDAGGMDVVAELAGRGCLRVLTGVYLEQPGPYATPENPVLVSVQVFAFPDAVTANDMNNLLSGDARWRLTVWCTQSGVGNNPCSGDFDGSRSFEHHRAFHRYVIAARSVRTDLADDTTIDPWLNSAAHEAVMSCGPQNHRGDARRTPPLPEPVAWRGPSWDSSSSDLTPFTAEALLSRRFTDSKGIEFARLAGAPQPCDQAGAVDVVTKLIGRGCLRVMTGVFLEQLAPHGAPPALVSVQIFPFPDTATAVDMESYLGEARWRLAIWHAPTGDGHTPRAAGVEWHQCSRWLIVRRRHRYVITALALRTDLALDDGSDPQVVPRLITAAEAALDACGPHIYRGD